MPLSQTADQELTAIGNFPANTPASDILSRLTFSTRRELLLASRETNPADPLTVLVTQRATVVSTARTRANNNTTHAIK